MRKRAVMIFTCKNKILLIKRRKGILDYYCLPGGTVEANESAVATITREIKEELGHVVCTQTDADMVFYLNAKNIGEESFYFHTEVPNMFEPKLGENSPEYAKISDTYLFDPLWLPIADMRYLHILPVEIKKWMLTLYFEQGIIIIPPLNTASLDHFL